ncbi:RNA-binding domain-containing protein [Geothrix sp. 21YS21S-2]|uniref:RNA-binding domain-containing protein n=1 Tax=Geothrix sp. 21YS21S-2 TaxID=3068893 RepID=UPI0027B9FFA9|nr:RNA-binding domain-containing protein [Geothrix sp. 21YS21S-2]
MTSQNSENLHLLGLLPEKESLTTEFKSDLDRLPDRELVESLVGMANSEGGVLFLGVENNATPTGLHKAHARLEGLPAMVANLTRPPLGVKVEAIEIQGVRVARILVPRSRHLVATSDGRVLRRRIREDGQPEDLPVYPGEYLSRKADLGVLDYSALPLESASLADFDPLERSRLRQMMERYRGDLALLSLSDEELDGALGLVQSLDGRRLPTVTGLLLIGKLSSLSSLLPTHEVAFQVMEGTDIRVNRIERWPLLRWFEHVEEQFEVRYQEEEMDSGLFRVPVPNFDRRAFREAFVNALVHRDYARLGMVRVLWEQDGIRISGPGGFPEGVTKDNLLTIDPTPRNPRLADALKRIGLAERSGRGVDRIYAGLLRFGRLAPDYTGSTTTSVAVTMPGGQADLDFLRVVLAEEKRRGEPLSLDALIILSCLRHERRAGIEELARSVQRTEAATRGLLERMVESGLLEAHGSIRDRSFTLSAPIYRQLGQSTAYVRQTGLAMIQQEAMVLKLAKAKGSIKRADVMDLCGLSESAAKSLLGRLVKEGRMVQQGQRRWTIYLLNKE